MSRCIEDIVTATLQSPRELAAQADYVQAATLERQVMVQRQRAGSADKALRRAEAQGAPVDEIARLKARRALRVAQLQTTLVQARAANIRRPFPDPKTAQVLVRASGPVEAPPLTLAALDLNGQPVATVAANEDGIAHLVHPGALEEVTLQLSDCEGRVGYRSARPVSIGAGEVRALDVTLSTAPPDPCDVPSAIRMPMLIGQDVSTARAILARLGLPEPEIVTLEEEGPPDIVLAQEPAADTVLPPEPQILLTLRRPPHDTDPNMIIVPDLIGARAERAEAELAQLGLQAALKPRPDDGPSGIVLDQDPTAGTQVTAGSTVGLIVSRSRPTPPDTTVVPDLRGATLERARGLLEAAGLRAEIRQVSEPNRPAGILEQKPAAGEVVLRQSMVSLLLNQPSEPPVVNEVIVPRVIGLSLDDATQRLAALGLGVMSENRISTAPRNQVIAQTPEAGARVGRDTIIGVVISTGVVLRPMDDSLRGLMRRVEADPRAEPLLGEGSAVTARLQSAGIGSMDAARALAEADPRELQQKLGFTRLRDAQQFGAMLRKALRDMD